ncbi:major facilitator superfamily domain-containing protein [Hypoxylon rubiginosum]|uniref:Major facilitator superfamily domain-containing protein n=1 Tax=Hypoxylon rubiginosum TaxID=110542 RepID=A0ACC0CZZ3_9PEZI|nr:major facilitator superfamily domain-containing protein [Hypoxylon rubiginosum]
MDVSKKDASVAESPVDNTSVRLALDPEDPIQKALAEYQPGSPEEKKLLRKIDLFLVPCLWFMCVLAYVDRNNIGNAKAAGMSADLGLTDSNYSMLISIFFIGYLILEVPSNILLSKCRPSLYLAGIMAVWGALVAGMSQVKNYHGILIFRFFLGMIEAGFMPGVMFLMSCWYTKSELGKRFSIFFTALCISGAVSGLLSGAIISGLEGAKGMEGWRWLFLIEGVITVAFSIFSTFILLDYPGTSRRLSADERQLATVRILHDKKESSPHGTKKLSPLQAIWASLVDLKVYFFVALYLLDNGCATINYFVPTVVQNMGYAGVRAQWMTVPIWIVATAFLCIVPQTADRYKERRWHITFGFTLAFVSGIIIVTVENNLAARYAFICFYISGVYSAFPLILTWASETMSLPSEKRAVSIAIVNAIGNLAAIYGSYMWPSTDAPEYKRGFTAMAGMCGAGAIIAALMPVMFKYLPKFTTKAERELEIIDGRGPERD